MTFSVPVRVKCGKCLNVLIWSDNVTPETHINCTKCGEYNGTYGEIEKNAAAAVSEKLESIISGKKYT
jgi:hypothetical protein